MVVESLLVDFFFALAVPPLVPVAPLVPEVEPLVPVADGLAVADELSDWSPVVAEVLLDSDWLPVEVVVLLVSDWSPVDVVLSIVTVLRPRRSRVGFTVEVEPVTDAFTSEDEPVTDDVLLEVEPLIEGVEEALVPLVPLVPLMPPLVEPDDSEPVLPVALPESEPAVVPAWLSGMQSMWTGLAEWSLARPVLLSACLPAFGWFRLLHSGFDAVAEVAPLVPVAVALLPLVPDVVEALLPVDGTDCEVRGCCVVELLVVWASAGMLRALTTAAASTPREN